jgi:hypothetical protein
VRFEDLFGAEDDLDDAADPFVEHRRPEWLGPPEGELGVAVPLGVTVARSATGVVALSHALAYSTGVSFTVVAHVGGLRPSETQRVFHDQHAGRAGAEELPDGFLRIGIELPDGTRASNLGRRRSMGDAPPSPPVLFQGGGGGGQSGGRSVSWEMNFWLWPLPSDGVLRVYCAWPIAAIETASAEVATGPLLAASRAAERVWSPSADDGGAMSSSSQYMVARSTRSEQRTTAEAPSGEATLAAELRDVERALADALSTLRRLRA